MGRLLFAFGTILTAVLLAAIAVYGFIYSGSYNVAASEPHTRTVSSTFQTFMRESVKEHAKDIQIPSGVNLKDSVLIERAAKPYDEMCRMCHGAPGIEPVEWLAMNPEPPDLAKEATNWSDAELYWIIKHGVKMTGMPAFGPSHSDTELWDLTGFVRNLADMSPERYSELTKEPATPEAPAHRHSHSH
jgi:hypothetical protein